ncbi:hypothetical protein [Kribbella sp. NPDC006257]|uniref:hypothetical protein n=1 Tax=Kribbella sp. NPDC006257 TaxID=3156738 RepID=UPI0033A456BD
MAGGLPETANAVGTQIGRYFSLASLLPSLIFVLWVTALRGASKPFGRFDLDGAGKAITDWSPAKVGLMVVSSLLLGLLVHPLLFATTQLLEGYWGPRPFAVRLATAMALRHRRRQHQLEDRADASELEMERALDAISRSELGEAYDGLTPEQQKGWRVTQRASPDGAMVHGLVIAMDSTKKVLSELPKDADRMLPTRLGNALRCVEDAVGRQYGLDLITIAPHLAVAAAPTRSAYIDDSREQLDVSVRMAFYGLLGAVLTSVWLLGAGWWLLVALVPYTFAFVTYRGAVASAAEWGAAMATCVDLDRFAMYDAMHVEWPSDTDSERTRNRDLMRLLQGERVSVSYVRRPSS